MKFCLITYGCKLNHSDSEIMRTLLLSAGLQESLSKEADLVIINTCGVVEKTERKTLKQTKEFKNQNKKVILAGCLPAVIEEECKNIADAILGVRDINKINEAVNSLLQTQKYIAVNGKDLDKAKMKKQEKPTGKDISTIVAIAEGCLGDCTYCATKLARKKLKSFASQSILKEVTQKLNSGYQEIQLTSQDLAIYGFDEQQKLLLPELLKALSQIKGDFKIKLGMMNPGQTKIIINDILKIMQSERFYKFLHIPMQSGSDQVLKAMKRNNKIADFVKLAEKFRKSFPTGVLATDIIVGHPTETEADFQQTLSIIQKTQPDVLHAFKFSKRKGTADYFLKDLPDRIKKDRSRILNKVFEQYNLEKNKKYLNTRQLILIVRKSKNMFLARNTDGRAVVVKQGKIGEMREVKIVDYKWNYLVGE